MKTAKELKSLNNIFWRIAELMVLLTVSSVVGHLLRFAPLVAVSLVIGVILAIIMVWVLVKNGYWKSIIVIGIVTLAVGYFLVRTAPLILINQGVSPKWAILPGYLQAAVFLLIAGNFVLLLLWIEKRK